MQYRCEHSQVGLLCDRSFALDKLKGLGFSFVLYAQKLFNFGSNACRCSS